MSETEKAFRVVGTTDDVTACDCCGRSSLKSTVILLPSDASDPVYFGVTCAAKAMRQTVKYVRSEISAREAEEIAKRQAEANARSAEYSAWLLTNYGVSQAADLWAKGLNPSEIRKNQETK